MSTPKTMNHIIQDAVRRDVERLTAARRKVSGGDKERASALQQSPEWKAVEKKLSRQPPRGAGRFFAWLTDGMCDEDRAALHSYVPAPMVAILSKGFGRRYTKEIAGAMDAGSRRVVTATYAPKPLSLAAGAQRRTHRNR